MEIMCKGCGKHPSEIQEYASAAQVEDITPDEYVAREEGTFNRSTGQFWCTRCYIKVGMPLGTA